MTIYRDDNKAALPDFEDSEWDRMRVFHQAQVAVAVEFLRKHAGYPASISLPFGDFTVTVTTNTKQVTQ